MGNTNSTGHVKSSRKKVLPSGLKKNKRAMHSARSKPTATDSMDRIPIVLENATPTTSTENNPFDCPHHYRHSVQILQQNDQNDVNSHLQLPSPTLGQDQHHCCSSKRKNRRQPPFFDNSVRPASDCINDKVSYRLFANGGHHSNGRQDLPPPSSLGVTPSRSAPSLKGSTLTVGSCSCTSLDSLSSAPETYRHHQQRTNRAGSPITTGSSNRQSLYSQQWTLASVNDPYNMDEDEDDDEDINDGAIYLAKDLWRLRSVHRIREAVKEKQRRMHYFLKRVWKGDTLVHLENPTLIIQWACSSGAWCFDMALAYPDCTLIGLDEAEGVKYTPSIPNLSKRQSPLYEQDGGMAQFEDDSADLIVIRDEFMYFAPDDKWNTLLAEFYRVLKPGGFLEIYGHDFQLNATDPHGKKLDEWTKHLAASAGVSPDFPHKLEKHCSGLGFVAVDYRLADLPLGEWPVAPIMKEMGYLAKIIIIKRFQILKRWILRLEEGLTEEEYTETIKAGMEECERRENRFLFFYLGAQKPAR